MATSALKSSLISLKRRKRNLVHELAVEVIRNANRDRPADRLLKKALAGDDRLRPDQRRAAAEMVFAFYRWQGLMDRKLPLLSRIREARAREQDFLATPDRISDEDLRRVLPEWSFEHIDFSRAWLSYIQRPAALWLRAQRGCESHLSKQLEHVRQAGRGFWAQAFRYFGDADLFQTDLFQKGGFEIQDISSQAVGCACDPQPGQRWWDMCAGEGGKTLVLADQMQGKGCVWATDRATWRLQRLKMRAKRANIFNCQASSWELGQKSPHRLPFDGVLVDAPCSGLGTWQRNPHARWTVTEEDVDALAQVQARLLDQAATAVAPGGRLVYSVCTLTRRETDEVVETFQKAHPEFEPLSLKGMDLPEYVSPTVRLSAASLRILPHEWKSQGMFIMRWRKRS